MLYDWHIIKSKEYDIPIICVGNITVGGTGKTPVCEFLIEHLAAEYNLAVLSRGYRRRTRGYVEVQTKSPCRDVGDEPKQMKLKFPDVVVSVCKDRRQGVDQIRRDHPQVDMILLDDGFQYRRLKARANIVLMDYGRPIYQDHPLPLGRLRDTVSQLRRADIVLITKCPENISPLEMRIVRKSLAMYPYQSIFFTWLYNEPPMALFHDTVPLRLPRGNQVIAMAGVANPAPLLGYLQSRYNVVNKLIFDDHHTYVIRDLARMKEAIAGEAASVAIVTTEKDAVKLTNRRRIPDIIASRLYYTSVGIKFAAGQEKVFVQKLKQYVRTNEKHSIVHF
ncbi:tetraacyldisaccharide 4'-kinase [Bacteroidia bacterium]|nr:tetraacyldisaccharide 4'-kinase [Bacteroidia bacterium]